MSAKSAYHHGDLRRALLDEALSVIAQKGVAGLSLRDVAARTGVSHAAPYHHFADKTALLTVLAREGMELMDARMAEAQEAAGVDPVERLLAVGIAYVTFAVDHPDYYAAFTAPELAALQRSADEAPLGDRGVMWARLMDAAIACQKVGELPPGDPVVVCVHLWSLVHGLAELWRTGPLPQLPHAAGGVEPFTREVLSLALRRPAQ